MASVSVDEKKEAVYNVEYVETNSTSSDVGFTQKQTNSMIRKMDWRLLPFLSLLYLLSFLDRTYVMPSMLVSLKTTNSRAGTLETLAWLASKPRST